MTTAGFSLSGSQIQWQSIDAVHAPPPLTVVEPPKVNSHHDGVIKTRDGSVESSNESCGSSGSVDESGNLGTLKAGDGSANLYLTGVGNLKKRKAPLPLEEDAEPDDSVSVPRVGATRIISNLLTANMNAFMALRGDTARAAVLAKEIVKRQDALSCYLRSRVLLPNKKFLDKEALMKARSLLELAYELLPLKKYLSNKCNSLLEKQSVLVLELNMYFFTEA